MEPIKNLTIFSEAPVAVCLFRDNQVYYPEQSSPEFCPDCGANLVRLGYCISCPLCGFGSCG
jgi:hypothetical protein